MADSLICISHYKNLSQIPLIINDVKGSCGCMIPNFSHNYLEQNKIDSVEIKIFPKKNMEYFNKTVVINANTQKKIHVIRIKCEFVQN